MAGKNHRKRIRRLEALRVNQPQRFEVLRRQSFASRTFELIEAIEANSTTEFAKILQRVVEQYPHEFEEFKQMALLRICATAAEKLCDLDQLSIVNWRKVLGTVFGDEALVGIADEMVARMSEGKMLRRANDFNVHLWAIMEFLKEIESTSDDTQRASKEQERDSLDEAAALITKALASLS